MNSRQVLFALMLVSTLMIDLQATYVTSKVTYKFRPFLRNYLCLRQKQNYRFKPVRLQPKFAFFKAHHPEIQQTKLPEPYYSIPGSMQISTDLQTTQPPVVSQTPLTLTSLDSKISSAQVSTDLLITQQPEVSQPPLNLTSSESKITSTQESIKDQTKPILESFSPSFQASTEVKSKGIEPPAPNRDSATQSPEVLVTPQALTDNNGSYGFKTPFPFIITENLEPE